MKKFYNILLILLVLIYFYTINELSTIQIVLMRLMFAVALILYIVRMIKEYKEKRKVIITTSIMIILSLSSVLIFLGSNGYVLSESYYPWNNVYANLDGYKVGEVQDFELLYDFESRTVSLNDFDSQAERNIGIYSEGEVHRIEDKIEVNNYIYYIVLIRERSNIGELPYYETLQKEVYKLDGNGIVVDRITYTEMNNEDNYNVRFVGNDEDVLYYYYSTCDDNSKNDNTCSYSINTIDSQANSIFQFEFETSKIIQAKILDNYLYTLSGDSEKDNQYLRKYSKDGKIILEKKLDEKFRDVESIDFHSEDMFLDNGKIYLDNGKIYLDNSKINSNNHAYNSNTFNNDYSISVYNMNLDFENSIIYEIPSEYASTKDVNVGDNTRSIGDFFEVYEENGLYSIYTYNSKYNVSTVDVDVYYNPRTSEITIDSRKEYPSLNYVSKKLHTDMIFTIMLITYLLLFLMNISFKDEKKIISSIENNSNV